MNIVKLTDTSIEVTKQQDATKVAYEYGFLINQKAQIIKSCNDYLQARQKEIDEVDALLAECEKLGISIGTMPSTINIKEG